MDRKPKLENDVNRWGNGRNLTVSGDPSEPGTAYGSPMADTEKQLHTIKWIKLSLFSRNAEPTLYSP